MTQRYIISATCSATTRDNHCIVTNEVIVIKWKMSIGQPDLYRYRGNIVIALLL